MATEIFANNIKTTLVSAIAADDTSILVYYADFPDIGGETTNYSRAVITSGTAPGSAYEYLVVDQTFYESGMVTLEVQRGQEGSVGFDWPAGSILYLAATAASFNDLRSSLIGRTDTDSPYFTMLGYGTPLDGEGGTSGEDPTILGDSVFIGYNTGNQSGNRYYNTYVGAFAAQFGYGVYNTAVGSHALEHGGGNGRHIAIGAYAMKDSYSGSENIAIGINSLLNNSGDINIAIGSGCLSVNEGDENIAIGYYALQGNLTGYNNTAIGYASQGSSSTGHDNISIGVSAMFGDYTETITGSYNVAIGPSSLRMVSTGASNIAIGDSSLYSTTTGNSNTAVGTDSSRSVTTGTHNVSIGRRSLYDCTTGSGNIAIGGMTNAGVKSPAYQITTQNNYASFGSTSLTNAYIQVAWTVNSDLRNKIVHSAVPHGLDFVNSLLPIKYQFKEDRESEVAVGPIRYGFGAQDILALEGENPVIIDNSEEENLRFNESSLIPILVKAIQELTAEVQALKTKVG